MNPGVPFVILLAWIVIDMAARVIVPQPQQQLYIVIYAKDKVGGSIGPLPYGKIECEERLLDLKPTGALAKDSNTLKLHEVKLTCEYRNARPIIDPSYRD